MYVYVRGGVDEAFESVGKENSLGSLPQDFQDEEEMFNQCLEWSS